MANKEDAAGVGLALLILLQIPSIFSALLPLPCDISKEDPSSEYSKRIRFSELQATGIAVGLGFAGSLITDTPWPFIGAAVIAGIFLFHYENSLRYKMGNDY